MAHLPPVTWNEVAIKDDVAALGTSLRSAMHAMGVELRSEMRAMGTELRTEMQTMRTEMHVGFAGLRAELVEASNRQLKWLVTFAAGWTSLLVTLTRFMP